MQHAVARASDLSREGRWDAAFHIALATLRERVGELRATVPEAEAKRRLALLPRDMKECLLVLNIGSFTAASELNVSLAADRYPHLSLALVERDMQAAAAKVRARIARDQTALETLLAIGEPAAPQPDPDAADEAPPPGPGMR